MCEWTDCQPLPTLTTDLEPHLLLPQTSCKSLLPRPAEPSTLKQPLLPSEWFQFSSEENLLKLAKDLLQLIIEAPQNGHSMYLSSGSKLETHTILKIHCSILTSQSLLSKLGKLMERSIHQVQYISYSVDYSTAALEGNNSRLSKFPQQARQSFSPLAWHTRCTLSQASFQWHRCTSKAH